MEEEKKTPGQEGYQSLLKFSEGDLSFVAAMMKWANEWMDDNGYDSKSALFRMEGTFEIMAKRK